MRDFYMTLLSNSSMDYYPGNKTSSFTVQLPRYIRLDGDWEVGVVEVQYPYTFINVRDGENKFTVLLNIETVEYKKAVKEKKTLPKVRYTEKSFDGSIKEGFYRSMVDILDSINSVIAEGCNVKQYFHWDNSHHVVTSTKKTGDGNGFISCTLKGELARQLGFKSGDEITGDGVYGSTMINMNVGLPEKMLFYCDILEPQFFGDTFAKVLRTINTTPNKDVYFGKNCTVTFNPAQYIPLQQKHFESISIDIRDAQANLIPFESGTSVVKLHFRRRSE